MKNQIIIHAAGKQTRIALLENNELAQLFIESPENQRTVGDIYVAEVRKVMGGIRAAFIDMNTPKDAFLHFSDLGEHLDDYLIMLNGQDALPQDAHKRVREFREKKDDSQNTKNGTTAEEQNLLGSLLKPGHKVLVQIVKEPIGSKGPRVSTNISIAGRFLVLIPMGDYVAVSKRIRSYKERRQLRQTVADILPEGFGVIVRTVAEGVDQKLIEEDLNDVLEKWNNIVKNLQGAKPPTLLHRDLDMTESLVRDLFAKDFERILVDDPKMHKTLKHYVSKIAPNLLPNIQLYKGNTHIFDHMNIMQDVESVFSPRVKMPSGGYLIFEQTEAMYVVDVNSGRYAAKKAQEDNSLKTNLESAREIAKQLRLRDIGGIIVVDFIDLRDEVNRKKVYDELKKEFRKDRAKTNVLPMSDFGLVQITRQRIRPSVVKSVSRVCPMCGGGGSIVSQNTILSDIESWLSKFRHTTTFRSVDLHINPYMRGMLTKGWVSQHFKWMLKYRLRIGIIEDISLSMNDYKFTLSGSDVEITETILHEQSIEAAIKAAEKSIAELESEHKRDSTTLDIYKKAKSRSEQSSRNDDSRGRTTNDDANRSRDRSDNDQRGTARGRSAASDAPKAPRRSTPAKQAEPIEEPMQETEKPDKTTKIQANPQRRNQKISKYYKKSGDEGEEDVNTSGEQPSAPKPAETPKPSVQDAEIPDELSHLRSAWEVAKEYKRKREMELQNESNAPAMPDDGDKQEKQQEPETKSAPAITVKNPETPANGQNETKPDDASTPEKQQDVVNDTSKSDGDSDEPESESTEVKEEAVKAASGIVQALVASSKLKEDTSAEEADEEKEDSAPEQDTTEVVETEIVTDQPVKPRKKTAAAKTAKTKKKAPSGKKAKTAEEVARKTAAKRKSSPAKEDGQNADDRVQPDSDTPTQTTGN